MTRPSRIVAAAAFGVLALTLAPDWADAGRARSTRPSGSASSGSSSASPPATSSPSSGDAARTRSSGRSASSTGKVTTDRRGIRSQRRGRPRIHLGLFGAWGHTYYSHLGHHYYGYPLGFWGYGQPYGVRAANQLGALDLNVKPKKAEVYLDGYYVGTARQYDGLPGHLWLEKGTYELTFYLPGYQTVSDTFRVLPGVIIDVNLHLEPGEAIPPPEPAPLPAGGPADLDPGPAAAPPDYGSTDAPPYRERASATRQSSRLSLDVRPGDASVYLDGEFLGMGAELSALPDGVALAPGPHEIQAVRPGYLDEVVEFTIEAGERSDLRIRLDSGS